MDVITIHNVAVLQLTTYYRAVVDLRASSSWWGFTYASDRLRLEAFFRRGHRHGLYAADKLSVTHSAKEADKCLFHNIMHSSNHLLRNRNRISNVRPRSHNYK